MFGSDRAKLKKVSVSLPWGIGTAEWETDESERRAAWELYVELVTRITVQPLGPGLGLMREALSSLYSLFGATRQILRAAGPDIGASRRSVGGVAIRALNQGLRPFLSGWHPLLEGWEAQRPQTRSPKEWEDEWPESAKLRTALEALRADLEKYAEALAAIAGVEQALAPERTG